MAKLIALPSKEFGGKVWINPDAVSRIHQSGGDYVIIRMIGGTDEFTVQGEASQIVAKLNSVTQREPV